MGKFRFLSFISCLLLFDYVYAKDMKLISKNGNTINVELSAKSENCTIYVNKTTINKTTCTKMKNSKQVRILCTPKKKICKTEQEVFDFIKINNDDFTLVKKDTFWTQLILHGNNENCSIDVRAVDYGKGRVLANSEECIFLTNSKNIDILCTNKKTICKTIEEVEVYADKQHIRQDNLMSVNKVTENSNYHKDSTNIDVINKFNNNAEYRGKILKRVRQIAGLKAGCKTQAELTCYLDNKYMNLCKKVGMNIWYKTCLDISSLKNGATSKENVANALR